MRRLITDGLGRGHRGDAAIAMRLNAGPEREPKIISGAHMRPAFPEAAGHSHDALMTMGVYKELICLEGLSASRGPL